MLLRLAMMLAGLLAAMPPAVAAAPAFAWPGGARAAIVLTYDDALRSQLDIALPQLQSAGLRATFFLDGRVAPEDLPRWRAAQASGHELGNHSFFHPCPAAAFPADPRFHSESYSIAAMLREIAAMNTFLAAIDGRSSRTYAVPCSQTRVGGEDYVEALRASGLVRHVRTGGTGEGVVTNPGALDRFAVPSRSFTEVNDAADLVGFAQSVLDGGGLGVYMFHGVGGDYQNVSAEAHLALLDWLGAHGGEIWVGTFGEVMDHVAAQAHRGQGR